MPTLRQLEYLAALAETRHFRRAAERVGVRQPTLSAQIAALEDRLGVQLVERSRAEARLTDAGAEAMAIVERVLADVESLRRLAERGPGAPGAALRFGLAPTIGPYLLPRVLPGLHAAHPELTLHVREEPPAALFEALLAGAYDMVLAPLPAPSADIESAALFREPLVVVAPAGHRFARAGRVTRADLDGEAVLALERGHQLHEQVEALCEEFGARLQFDYAGTSLETLAQMVSLGMGISFLPGLFVERALAGRDGVTALPLQGRSLSRTVGLAWRRGAPGAAARSALDAHIREAVARDFPSFPRL